MVPDIRLLFTDVGLPGGMNGRELADAALRLRPSLRVLFTTGYARSAIVHHGRLDPDIQLISKPFTAAALATKIRELLDGGESFSSANVCFGASARVPITPPGPKLPAPCAQSFA